MTHARFYWTKKKNSIGHCLRQCFLSFCAVRVHSPPSCMFASFYAPRPRVAQEDSPQRPSRSAEEFTTKARAKFSSVLPKDAEEEAIEAIIRANPNIDFSTEAISGRKYKRVSTPPLICKSEDVIERHTTKIDYLVAFLSDLNALIEPDQAITRLRREGLKRDRLNFIPVVSNLNLNVTNISKRKQDYDNDDDVPNLNVKNIIYKRKQSNYNKQDYKQDSNSDDDDDDMFDHPIPPFKASKSIYTPKSKQLGKSYSSNNMGDGPSFKITDDHTFELLKYITSQAKASTPNADGISYTTLAPMSDAMYEELMTVSLAFYSASSRNDFSNVVLSNGLLFFASSGDLIIPLKLKNALDEATRARDAMELLKQASIKKKKKNKKNKKNKQSIPPAYTEHASPPPPVYSAKQHGKEYSSNNMGDGPAFEITEEHLSLLNNSIPKGSLSMTGVPDTLYIKMMTEGLQTKPIKFRFHLATRQGVRQTIIMRNGLFYEKASGYLVVPVSFIHYQADERTAIPTTVFGLLNMMVAGLDSEDRKIADELLLKSYRASIASNLTGNHYRNHYAKVSNAYGHD